MEELTLIYEPFPQENLTGLLERRLISLGVAATQAVEGHPLGFVLKNARGEWLGGISGFTWGGWLQVRLLWVAAGLRSRGHGTRLLQAAEQFAREHDCTFATLETFSFEAPGFYVKRGYTVFGQLDDYPPGHTKFFLRKDLRIPNSG